MKKRFVSIWFRQLTTDWFILRRPALKNIPFALSVSDHGRLRITAANPPARAQGVNPGMTVSDARILIPGIEVLDDKPQLPAKLLRALARWCVRYTPITAIDPPDGLILDVTGCAHLWNGETPYLREIITRLRSAGYDVRSAMADTIGAAWAISRYGQVTPIIESGQQLAALLPLPPDALRLEPAVLQRLQKLGLYQINNIIGMPRSALRRRFGKELLLRLDQALGNEEEFIETVQPVEAWQDRLPCLEPILTAGGIEIALTNLLGTLCGRLQQAGKGIRTAVFKGYRIDGRIVQIEIGTNRPSHNSHHLFKLFVEKIPTLQPDPGIELFTLEAPKVDEVSIAQESLWNTTCGLDDVKLSELLDRLTNKFGAGVIHRYLPDEHHWPERSIKPATSLREQPASPSQEKAATSFWPETRRRPVHLLSRPEPIEVTAPIPDYPPMLFRYKDKLHTIKKADGPERIEQEWWLEGVRHRDYYSVEDEEGARYWLFRSGHYTGDASAQWFIHGFFP